MQKRKKDQPPPQFDDVLKRMLNSPPKQHKTPAAGAPEVTVPPKPRDGSR